MDGEKLNEPCGKGLNGTCQCEHMVFSIGRQVQKYR